MYKILEKKIINSTVEQMVIHAPFVARKCEPGQFVILRVDDEGERVPFTIADFDREAETITIIYQIMGQATQLLAQKEVGDTIRDFAGPLGAPAVLHKHDRILGIGGGVGSAPLYPQVKRLVEMGVECEIILGGRSAEFVILEEEFAALGCKIHVVTDDGSKGDKGFVTSKMSELLAQGEKYDQVIAIGPLVMMKAVVDIAKPLDLPTMVSLNPIMIDGTGMCGGCRVTVGGETKFACVDGPEFDGLVVDFDEAMNRQGAYKKQEAHRCNIGLREEQ